MPLNRNTLGSTLRSLLSTTPPPASLSKGHLKRMPPSQHRVSQPRPLSTTARCERKSKSPSTERTAPSSSATDFSALEADIDRASTRLKANLATCAPGGRTNTSLILEELKVGINPSSAPAANKSPADKGKVVVSVPLGDLATIVMRGRQVHVDILPGPVGTDKYRKAIEKAILGAGLDLVPATSSSSSCGQREEGEQQQQQQQLIYTLPVPTAESRRSLAKNAEQWKQQTVAAIGTARQKRQKMIKEAERSRALRPDDARKALAQMDKIVAKAHEDAKKITEQTVKKLDA